MQLDFEVDNVINLVPTQTLHWSVEYPAGTQTTSRQTEKVSHLYISSADIQGIVPLAEVRDDLIDEYRYRYLWAYILTFPAAHTCYICWNRLNFSLHFPPPSNLLVDTPSHLLPLGWSKLERSTCLPPPVATSLPVSLSHSLSLPPS